MLKRSKTLLNLTSHKKTTKHKRLVLRLEALYFVKNIFYLYFSPLVQYQNSDQEKSHF